MDLFEKINRSFGSWYEGLFGGAGDDVRPKDILRRILAAMEDNRKEGFDNRVYVPNQYVLEINVHDEEEKEYLLSFLDRGELEAAIKRYCQQNHYHIRGPLDFTIKEVDDPELDSRRGEKIRVRCRYNTKITGPEAPPVTGTPPNPNGMMGTGSNSEWMRNTPTEERTVASVYQQTDNEESGTVPAVAYGALVVYAPDRAPFRYTIARGNVGIGRSAKSGNDLVIDSDGQISKKHARIELDAEGRFTLYDLGSTNGSKVNGRRVDNRLLNDGDEITLGTTRLVFQQTQRAAQVHVPDEDEELRTVPEVKGRPVATVNGGGNGAAVHSRAAVENRVEDHLGSSGPAPPIRSLRARTARLILTDKNQDVDDFLLASETVIGRGVTNDIVLPDRSVATRHARIASDGVGYTLESLGNALTTLNGMSMPAGHSEPLKDGDRITLGDLHLRFESGQP
jgi:pSer/pThr/pTyr-binding forkhead associated (FHA) protein